MVTRIESMVVLGNVTTLMDFMRSGRKIRTDPARHQVQSGGWLGIHATGQMRLPAWGAFGA